MFNINTYFIIFLVEVTRAQSYSFETYGAKGSAPTKTSIIGRTRVCLNGVKWLSKMVWGYELILLFAQDQSVIWYPDVLTNVEYDPAITRQLKRYDLT